MLNIKELGQVFTPKNIVDFMLSLVKNQGRFLEPSCGDGAFYSKLPANKLGIEIDKRVIIDSSILNMDFFELDTKEKFDTIIGNPPYVRHQDINPTTKALLKNYEGFDRHSNLYLFFIYKSILHLNRAGELIFITPRDFLKATSARHLNKFIYSCGTITNLIDLGDSKVFKGASPNCIIWRFEKDNFDRKGFSYINGQLLFLNKKQDKYCIPFSKLFYVKVGAVSGADEIFSSELHGDTDFVCSSTAKTGKTKKMIYAPNDLSYLERFKDGLLARRIKRFNENNWYKWGRGYYRSDEPRIYLNTKTRNPRPFFIHETKAYDGSILAIFPRFKGVDLNEICELLNNTNWQELGFVCDGRFIFSQRSLECTLLDTRFKKFLEIL